MKFFEYDGGFMRTATILSRLTLLNLLWLACCIPLVTIGAATAAQHHCAACLMRGDIHIGGNFKEGLRLYWKKGTVIWICSAVLGTAFGMACYMLNLGSMPYKNILMIMAGIAFLTMVLVLMWVYPVMVNFSGKLSDIVFNSFIFAFMYAPVTLIAAVFYGIAVFLFLRFLATRLLVILFGPTVVVYCTLVLFEKVFQKYKKKE